MHLDRDSGITVIIPAHNEEETIGEVVGLLRKINKDYEILVIDDGSKDATFKNAIEYGAKIIRHPYNIGNGAAIKTGIRNAKGDIIVFLDADLQHRPEDVPKILNDIGTYDMVVGARGNKSKNHSLRKIGNRVLSAIASYISGKKILDLTSGFRAIKKDVALRFLHILPNGYSYPTTLTLSLLIEGYTVKFVPLDILAMRGKGKSDLRLFREGIKFLIIILRMIVLFNPLKVFIPVGCFLVLYGTASLTHDVYNVFVYGGERYGIEQGTILALVLGILIVFFGFLADQIASIRREMSSFLNKKGS